ncbi:MAG: hypothetical protein K2M63_08115 [Muribaculaceae bacterium]|nr:hypothetical protein [Muribaculaceae bacterium]
MLRNTFHHSSCGEIQPSTLYPTWFPYGSVLDPVVVHEREALFHRIWR